MKRIILLLAVAATLSACASKPVLNEVDSKATLHPINTPEEAALLKKQYERK